MRNQRAEPATLATLLDRAAAGGRGVRFLNRRKRVDVSYADLRLGALACAAGLHDALGTRHPGAPIGIVARTGPEVFHAVWGCIFAGLVPAMLPPPQFGSDAGYQERVARLIAHAGIHHVLLPGKTGTGISWPVDVLEIASGAPPGEPPAPPKENDTALVQFSSGTTGHPKAIRLSHRQIVSNINAMVAHLGLRPDVGAGVSWLPLHHDMGLVGGLFTTLAAGMQLVLMSPETFLMNPVLWLETISASKGFASAAPTFALAQCLQVKDVPEGLDLSHLQRLIVGAERVDADIVAAFARRFASFGLDPGAILPAYGMAEAGLALTMRPAGQGSKVRRFDHDHLLAGRAVPDPDGLPITSNGPALQGYELAIRDGKGAGLPAGRIGQIHVRGPSVGTNGQDWLATGDLGFVDDEELYVTGRSKDVIILNGVNYAAPMIEATAVAGLPKGSVCAALAGQGGQTGAEQLIIVAEPPRGGVPDDLAATIKTVLAREMGLVPAAINVLKPGAMPRTTSGKIRKLALLEMITAGNRGEKR